MTVLCIYHGNCADGFGAAWAVRHALKDNIGVEFHPGVYGEAPPDVTGRAVLLVDFSYKRSVLMEMAQKAKTIVILDHHKTAAEDLAGFREPAPYQEWGDKTLPLVSGDDVRIAALFDMERSGARLAWDYFHPGEPAPWLILHIEDRDLWRFKMPKTREIQAAVFSHPYDFAVWDELFATSMHELAKEGEAIERKHFKDIDELLKVCRRRMTIAGHDIPVASLPYTMSSDAGHIMAKGEPFAACYIDAADKRIFSLRSAPEGLDVSEIAKGFGGGGHKAAAGFSVPRNHPLATA